MPISDFGLNVLALALIYAVVAASWDLLIGFAGQLSFGHAALFGVGGYAAALLNGKLGVSPWIGLPFAGATAATLGLVFGLPALRVRGPYLALTTLALMSATQVVIQNWSGLTNGQLGYYGYHTFPGIAFGVRNYYPFIVAYSALATLTLYILATRTRLGIRWRSLRDDETRARTLGLNVTQTKLNAFCISAFFAGTAGAVYANYLTVVTPDTVGFNLTALFVAMAVIGGRGTIFGAVLGALLVQVASEYLRQIGAVYNDVATGALVVAVIWLLPDGLLGGAGRLARRRWQVEAHGPEVNPVSIDAT